MDIEAYRLNAEVMKRLDMSTGMLNKYHQNYSSESDYMKNLEVLAYDMSMERLYIRRQESI